jgi:hypothetical protein
MSHQPSQPYRIIVTCGNCGYVLRTIKEAGEYVSVDTKTTKRITILMPAWMYDTITRLVKEGRFKSRTELITKAVLEYLEKHGLH